MSIFISFFNSALYYPIFNILILLYLLIQDLGVAIILLTLIIRFLLYPFSKQSIVSQKKMAELQPKIKVIQEKYKKNKQEQGLRMMALYKKEKFNPFSGLLPALVQFPILIALYIAFWRGIDANSLVGLYSFVPSPGHLNLTFLGLMDLTKASLGLALVAAVSQFWQLKMLDTSSKKDKNGKSTSGFANMLQKQMLYFFPFFTFAILLKFPSAIALYWITTNLFTIGQQYFFFKNDKNKKGK